MSNNNPILDEDTIIVSPFGGEADICPRDESASYFCHDFQGTNLQWSYENIYRLSKALFPPNPEVLKAICFRGYKDAIYFLKSRSKFFLHFKNVFVINADITQHYILSIFNNFFKYYLIV